MSGISSLASRIDGEFSAVAENIKKAQVGHVEEYKQRQNRVEQIDKVFKQLREVWRPRLEILVKKFGDRVQTTPRVMPTTREATFEFQSKLARVQLKFSATTERDIRKLIVSYDLSILPVLMRFKSHDELAFPLNAVDHGAVAQWVDDRLVDFVQTYLSMGENEIYMKDQMVEDPVAHVRFPKQAAAATLEWQGQKYDFVGEETRRDFAAQNKIQIG